MMLPEAEAKTKWCPFARVALHAGNGGATANRHPSDGSTSTISPPAIEEETRCIGSACMAWRWRDPAPTARAEECRFFFDDTEPTGPVVDEPQRPQDIPSHWEWEPEVWPDNDPEKADGGGWREPQASVDAANAAERAKRRGFCGLAGGVQ